MDITLGFGPSVPGSSPGESTDNQQKIRSWRIFWNNTLCHLVNFNVQQKILFANIAMHPFMEVATQIIVHNVCGVSTSISILATGKKPVAASCDHCVSNHVARNVSLSIHVSHVILRKEIKLLTMIILMRSWHCQSCPKSYNHFSMKFLVLKNRIL